MTNPFVVTFTGTHVLFPICEPGQPQKKQDTSPTDYSSRDYLYHVIIYGICENENWNGTDGMSQPVGDNMGKLPKQERPHLFPSCHSWQSNTAHPGEQPCLCSKFRILSPNLKQRNPLKLTAVTTADSAFFTRNIPSEKWPQEWARPSTWNGICLAQTLMWRWKSEKRKQRPQWHSTGRKNTFLTIYRHTKKCSAYSQLVICIIAHGRPPH